MAVTKWAATVYKTAAAHSFVLCIASAVSDIDPTVMG
ncbi:hypothetical protein NOGI109294_02935 [Nocardiopsis gilva]